MNPSNPDPIFRKLLERYPLREERLERIKEIEKELVKADREDEENDPTLIEGNIRMQRGYRYGCGTLLLCFALMCYSVLQDGHRWTLVPLVVFAFFGIYLLIQGVSYRPSVEQIHDSYEPHRNKANYRGLVQELEMLARSIAQDLQAEDEA